MAALMLVSESPILPSAAWARDFWKYASAIDLESEGNAAFLASRQEENSSIAWLKLPASIATSPNPEVASIELIAPPSSSLAQHPWPSSRRSPWQVLASPKQVGGYWCPQLLKSQACLENLQSPSH